MTLSSTPATARRLLPDAPLLVAARGERPNRVPVWFMRQAGRSLPEYRQLRADLPMLQACMTPELVCEIEYLGWTDDGRLRAAAFKGIRTDKLPEDCRREELPAAQ